jgi:hypothetical protein
MKVWIATDWNGTKIYLNKPHYGEWGNGVKEWSGVTLTEYSYRLLPKGFVQKEGECKEADIELILK